MKMFAILVTALTLSLGAVSGVWAAEPINTLDRKGLFGYKETGVALRGFDPVAYFTVGKPVEGRKSITTEWNGATWQFSSEEHRTLFEQEPEKYAPQYGGYCAYGVANGFLVKIEPDQWSIVDGKLYLNYDRKYQKQWEDNRDAFIVDGDSRFLDLLATE